ncbi:MAG TPA: O-antigen ligase family protein [Candidatus Brocadiia bacterium]|nr:O-antigen ligase family protein [Candidatus Brocadiales bacterium]
MDIRYTQIAAVVAVLSWFFNGLITKKLYFEKNILNSPIAILVGWMLLSLVWTVSVYSGIREFLQIFFGVIVFFLTINNVKDEKTLNVALKIWIIAGLLCALSGTVELITTTLPAVKKLSFGTITHWGAAVRISGLKENPHRLGFLLNVCLMIAVPLLITSKSRKYKAFLIFCICSMLVVLINTMSRSTWIGCFVGIACCSFYSKRLAKIFFISCLVVLVLFVTLAPDALQHAVIERFKGVLNPMQTSSIAGRTSVWDAGMKMFKEHPLTGVGIGSFSTLAKQYGSTHLEAPHDVYLFFLSEFGLIGLSIFLFLIFTVVASIIKGFKRISDDTKKFVLLGLFVGLIIYFTQGLVVSYKFLEMEIWALLGLAMASLKIFTSESEKEKGISKAQSKAVCLDLYNN